MVRGKGVSPIKIVMLLLKSEKIETRWGRVAYWKPVYPCSNLFPATKLNSFTAVPNLAP